ncbi:Signal transduction protein containing GAF and PtsI domains [Hartmannibacter diazotrophicus]|uniref:Signal transduction protein containing GAF and PtsI domains n=1 Tax=Hartmannibacter diazotrophicus TaxID=1482074 RepID=A0A2C9DAS2_9HYPH|nr:GAF domain-containing protein [Hartmannibacter diazotrophicus]SON56841.1 Signal transduction protein containing GAF and PtsI domains [Hartmannibacter diazotrophicus]
MTGTLMLDAIRDCLEGAVPSVMATCDNDGVPNVSLISHVHYVDRDHVALSYQFFNKTRANILSNGRASIAVIDPITMAEFQLDLLYEETQTSGPMFESMKARLAGIASHAGMQSVFRLLGSDVFKVLSIVPVHGPTLVSPLDPCSRLSSVRRTFSDLAGCRDLGELFDRTLLCLSRHFGIEQAMVLMLDEETGRLYTVATCGYPRSGIGSEVVMGEGIIGVAARERLPIRIGHMTSEYRYGACLREQALHFGMAWAEATVIPFPGLPAPESQIALPIVLEGRTIGVLFAESAEPVRFRYDDEDALALVADRLALMIPQVQHADAEVPESVATPEASGECVVAVRHYEADDSIFLDHDYLIKGVAGAIFWKIIREFADSGRDEFTNRELRLDPQLRLPEHAENLEARLVLLQRRLGERDGPIRIEKCGRGRFRLVVTCKPELENMGAGAEQAGALL